MIREIQLIHHTHADFGYTDLPSTSFAYLSRYLGEAVRIARETADFPEAARFHYTCEIGYVVEDFLATATPDERAAFDRLVAAGQFEVGAMPFHITALLDADEWRAQLDRSQPLFDRYRPRTCFQNDINGLPWGIIPALCDRGVRHVMMGINTYSGGVPRKPPCGFWWEGPDGRRLLAWISLHYCAGYNLFYDGEWRTGPVPAYPDVWFHPPVGRQIFDDSPQALAAAHAHLLEKLAADFADYPHSVLGVQVTNMWRMDNDPPCEQLCHFVRAWNEAGLQPALRLSTPTRFLDAIQREAGDSLPVARGDWGEWWADGPASMPAETALSQRTKRLLAELPAGAEALGAPSPDPARLAAIWRMAGLYTEHTFCSWHSLAQPSHPLTLGSLAQKANFAYQPDEDARTLRAEVLRAAPAYRPSSLTRHLTVLNPGRHPRADWVEIPAAALRQPANAVRDPLTGEEFVFEEVTGPFWSEPDADRPRPFEVPDDIFSFRTETLRFFCPPLAPGASRRFELVELSPSDLPSGERPPHFQWQWDEAAGLIRSLVELDGGHEWIDPAAQFGFGQPLFELPQGFGAREKLLHRQPCERRMESPRLVGTESLPLPHGHCLRAIWEHPHCHRIEQTWDFPHAVPRVELSTTFWLREVTAPQAVYLAFPFHLPGATAAYRSLGHPTRAGHDQLPDTCGEYECVGAGVEFVTAGRTLALATPDTPLGCFEVPAKRSGRTAFTPTNAHFFPIITANYWVTNFPHTKAAKFTTRHLIASAPLETLTTGLWAFPSA
jgi:hypothetical protein